MSLFSPSGLDYEPAETSVAEVIRPFNRPVKILMDTPRYYRLRHVPQKIEYEITQDAGLLHQYFRMREDNFIALWRAPNSLNEKTPFDGNNDIAVAKMGNQCIGGCCLTYKEPSRGNLLPLEDGDFKLADVLPQLPIADTRCVEISGLAILPEFQTGLAMLELTRFMIKRCMEKNAFFAFYLAPAAFVGDLRKTVQLFGVKWNVCSQISIPDRQEYEGRKMVLSMMNLTPLYHIKNKEAQQVELAEKA